MDKINLNFLLFLLIIAFPSFATISEESVIVNQYLVGSAEAISGDTFKFIIDKTCKEYQRAIDCTICKELSNRDKIQLTSIEEELAVIPKEKMYDRVRYCLECREQRDKADKFLGEECAEANMQEYIKLVDVRAPKSKENLNCLETEGAKNNCEQQSKQALQAILQDKQVRCEAEQITSMVENTQLVVVRECNIDHAPLNALMLRTGWVYLEFGAKLSLQKIEDETKQNKIGIWKYQNPNDF